MKFQDKRLKLERYPSTKNRSLQPWSAVDELLLEQSEPYLDENRKIVLIQDSFGALVTALSYYKPVTIVNNFSQLAATRINLKNNDVDLNQLSYTNPIQLIKEPIGLTLLKIPKSADLFGLYIQQIHSLLTEEAMVFCGFMTRNFTPRWLEIASHYFENVEQSKAKKKARILKLSKPKKDVEAKPLFHEVKNDLDLKIKQYNGVFSSEKIDIATQLLLKHLPEIPSESSVLDLACGNGVIGAYARMSNPSIKLTVLDDSYLALQSAKLNLGKQGVTYLWKDGIPKNLTFDYIFCNPPYHLEYENTIEIALSLFSDAAVTLKESGIFMIVANTHLNYRTHLRALFSQVSLVVQSGKYEVIECRL